MNALERLSKISLTLGLITVAGLFFAALALNDIFHNIEPDLNMEWRIVRMSFLFTLMFVAMASATIFKFKKTLSVNDKQ